MKETTKRILSLVLAFVMVLGLVPMLSLNAGATGEVSEPAATGSDAPDDAVTDATDEDSGESDLIEVYADAPLTAAGKGEGTTITKKTIYKLVSSLTAGEAYLIVNSNSVGNNRYALAASTTGVAVTVKAADTISDAVYIEDKGSALEWTAASSMGSWKFASGDYDLGYNNGLSFSQSSTWSYSSNENRLSTRSGNKNYYLRYSNNNWSVSDGNSNRNVYFYQKTEVAIVTPAEVDGIYSIAGDPDRVKVAVTEAGGTAELGSVLTFTPDNGGDASTTDTSTIATYEVFEDLNGIISEISGNTVSLTGVYGEALVMVSYYVEGAGLVTNYITVVADETNYITPEDGTDDFPEYPNEGAIRFDKNATAVGNFSQSGMAKVELSMTGVPYSVDNNMDVVIMMDMSTSMDEDQVEAAQDAANAALEAIVKNEDGSFNDNRVAVYTFNGWSNNYQDSYIENIDGDANNYNVERLLSLQTYTSTSLDAAKRTIENADATDSGTNYAAALKQCYTILKDNKTEGRAQYVIFLSDGMPTTGFAYVDASGEKGIRDNDYLGSDGTRNAANVAKEDEYYSRQMKKDGVSIYSVSLHIDNNYGKTILANIAGTAEGDGSDAGYTNYVYHVASDENADKLSTIFKGIVNEIKQAATNVVVTDKIGNDYDVSFDLPNEGVTESDTSGMTEFYMQVLEYQLDADKERTGTPKVLENFTFDANGALKSHTVDGVVTCEGLACTHVTFKAGRVIGIDGTYFEYTCAPAADAAGNELLDEMGDVVTEEFLTWKADKLTTTELALEYFVYLNNSAGFELEEQVPAGTYDTNEYADITYDNYQDNRVQQEYPVPSMTWNGAQVTYVFYLVNENGEPVNRAGRVIPFAEAIYVTEPVKKSVVWYGENSKTQLSAEYLASEIVPDVYALYDSNAYYEINVYQTEGVDGENGKNYNHFIIEGSADIANKNTTKVFNTKAGERYDVYGAYSNTPGTYISANSDTVYTVEDPTNLDYANTTVAFAVVWQPQLVEDVVVVDYGLDVVIDVATNDAMASGVVGVRADAPANVVINSGTYSAAKADSAEVKLDGVKIGTATVENNTSVRFSLDKDNGMLFSDAAVFYYESDVSYYTKDNTLQTTSMYSSVTVIPATTVYYEDSFVDFSSFTWNDGWVSSEKSLWTTEGTAIDGTQAQDRPGASKISADLDADNIYGFDGAYSAMSLYSNGSAAKATVDYDNYAQASFEFWGTGFDLISLTSNTTGLILVDVEKEVGGEWDEFDSFAVDTYYGYAQAQCHVRYKSYLATDGMGNFIDGQYEWVRKEILHGANECDGTCVIADKLPEIDKGLEVIVSENTWLPCEAENSIYQVPVIKMADQPYGHYRVTIKATYESFFDHVEGSSSYEFYLDAIRIYDPANDGADNEVIEDAYVADHEGWPSYIELRNQLIDAKTLGNASAKVEGMVFIDGDAEVGDAQIADYIGYGPNNEVYLASNQSVAFMLDTDANVDRVHIGIKSADGMTGTYTIKNVAANGAAVNEKTAEVSTATDLYYDLTAWKDGIIVISNTGSEGIISITNIKTTHTAAPAAEASMYMTREAAELVLNAMKPEPVNPFADVQQSEFFYESVLWAVENGITTGISDTHFGPYMYCSRAQVVTFLWRAAGSPEPVSTVNPFGDVKETDFFYKAVLWAAENGITTGLTAETFGPNALCNRAQVVTFLWRANGSVVCDAENPFEDVSADAFYRDAVIWAVENGITTGAASNAFDPNGTCMRAHVVTFLYRAYQLPEHSEI